MEVKFHDGTAFTAGAVQASFDRRAAVDQGPASMVKNVESVTTQGNCAVTQVTRGSTYTDAHGAGLTLSQFTPSNAERRIRHA